MGHEGWQGDRLICDSWFMATYGSWQLRVDGSKLMNRRVKDNLILPYGRNETLDR